MSITTQTPQSPTASPFHPKRPLRRLWHVPRSNVWWISLLAVVLLYGTLFLYFVKMGGFGYIPGTGPLPRFGIIALFLLPVPLVYTLRRRYFRSLPGKAQDWLWVHNWVGIAILLTVLLHANFYDMLKDYCYSPRCLSAYYGGPIALDGLLLLVITGVVGRLLDWRFARVITNDASSNGVGLVESIQERVRDLEGMVERLFAGKSEPFKLYCKHALSLNAHTELPYPQLPLKEHADFQHVCHVLAERTRLLQSLHLQRHARLSMRRWRIAHRILACVALCTIGLHLGWLALHVLGARFHL